MELTPGLHRIGNDLVAVHLVITPDGVTVVDAGLAGHRRALERELRAVGLSIADVRGVVLTHGDTDHLGFAERLRADHGIPVFVHHADAARARGEEKSTPQWGRARVLPVLRFLLDAALRGGLRTRHPAEVREFDDGDLLPLPGSPRIVALPGHSPGSVAVHVPAVRAVFVGDALTTRDVLTGASGPRPAPFTDDPAAASRALDAIAGLDVDLVVPGHGPVWRGSPSAAIAAYRRAEGSTPAA